MSDFYLSPKAARFAYTALMQMAARMEAEHQICLDDDYRADIANDLGLIRAVLAEMRAAGHGP